MENKIFFRTALSSCPVEIVASLVMMHSADAFVIVCHERYSISHGFLPSSKTRLVNVGMAYPISEVSWLFKLFKYSRVYKAAELDAKKNKASTFFCTKTNQARFSARKQIKHVFLHWNIADCKRSAGCTWHMVDLLTLNQFSVQLQHQMLKIKQKPYRLCSSGFFSAFDSLHGCLQLPLSKSF